MNDLVQLPKASVEKLGADILLTSFKANSEIQEQDAVEIDGAHLSMSQGGDVFVIVDLTAGGTKLKHSAENYFDNKSRMIPYIKAVAVIKDQKENFFARIFGRSNKLIFPKKTFHSKEEAEKWFDTLRN